MRRREFISLLGGAAVAWPVVGRAQQPAMPVIGFLSSAEPPAFAHLIDAFRQGLSSVGYIEGQNVAFEYRSAGDRYERFRTMADDLVRRQVAVVFANGGTAAALAAKAATSTIPVVFYMGGDPVAQGLVASLNRPGGNLTGFGWLGYALGAKRLELIRELVPKATVIGTLVNPNNPDSEFEIRDVQEAVRTVGIQTRVLKAGSESELNGVFEAISDHRLAAVLMASDAFFSSQRNRIVALGHAMRCH